MHNELELYGFLVFSLYYNDKIPWLRKTQRLKIKDIIQNTEWLKQKQKYTYPQRNL